MEEEQDELSLNDKIVNFISNNIVWVFLVFILIVIILPRLFIGTSKIGFLDNLKPNEMGDAIGGMTAPIIGLFSAFLVYLAFREQKKANDELIKFNRKQTQIQEFQNLKITLDYIHEIANDISIKDSYNNPIIGFGNCINYIFTLSDSIVILRSLDIENKIDIDQFINLEYKLYLLKEKINFSNLHVLDKQFLEYDVHNRYYINYYEHFSFEKYIANIKLNKILIPFEEILNKRANHLKRLIECLDQFHKY